MEQSIIDRDIAAYEADIEQWRTMLRRCSPSEEQKYKSLVKAAANAVYALQKYRELLQWNS